jgi:hypothetical protein
MAMRRVVVVMGNVQDRSPHMSFILNGSQIAALCSVEALVEIQDVNPRI